MTDAPKPELPDFLGEMRKLGLSELPFGEGFYKPRPFHAIARHKIKEVKRIILSMDKGLGKTGVALSVFEDREVNQDKRGFTVLIFTTEKGMGSFVRDINMFPDPEGKVALIYGNKLQREQRWKTAGRNPKVRYFVVTYAGFLSDIGYRSIKKEGPETTQVTAPKWAMDGSVDGVIADEFHRVFRSRKSKTFDAFLQFFRYTQYLILMSGSAVSKDPSDLWAALHILDRKFWSTFWGYVATWCELDENPWSKQRKIVGPKLDRVQKWRSAVRPYVFHVTADMVPNQLPPISRYPLDVLMEPWQRKLHDDLQKEQVTETPDGGYIFAPNSLSALHKIRTALICPKALDPSYGYGIGVESIFDDAEESELTRYAVFTPFRAPIPHLTAYLNSRGANVWVLQGSIGLDEQELRIRNWRNSLSSATPSKPSIIISTIKYAESWEIPEASYGYMLGYEWDPEDNKQAEGRIRRLISPKPVFVQYVRHVGAYDEEHLNKLIMAANNRMAMMDTWYGLKR